LPITGELQNHQTVLQGGFFHLASVPSRCWDH
jgi:hypothetical protein